MLVEKFVGWDLVAFKRLCSGIKSSGQPALDNEALA